MAAEYHPKPCLMASGLHLGSWQVIQTVSLNQILGLREFHTLHSMTLLGYLLAVLLVLPN